MGGETHTERQRKTETDESERHKERQRQMRETERQRQMRKIHNTQSEKETETEEREGQRDRDRWVGERSCFWAPLSETGFNRTQSDSALCPRGEGRARRKHRQKERQGTIHLTFKSVFSFKAEKV